MSKKAFEDFEKRAATVKGSVFGSSVEEWNAAWRALHDFAKASGAPLGSDVVKWLQTKTDEYHDTLKEHPAP